MNARKADQVTRELDAFTHWFAGPDTSNAGHFLTLTLFAESPDTARVARDMTAVFMRDTGAEEVVDDARLVVSELVGNVVNHALPDQELARPGGARRIDVTFKVWPKWVFLGVGDEDSSPPLLPLGDAFPPGLAGELSEAVLPDSGRGLLIVQRLAAAVWWRQDERGGKTVWCRFDRDSSAKDPTDA
ncbi:ATP-binding protein [Streptomyces sp. NPDC051445]|uniref:ATP-binding protein n=1 Tax=unclassified Streptomyces TaxID=2593676 RepID=UPI003716E7B6